MKSKLRDKKWFIVLMTVIFFPLGLYWLWTRDAFDSRQKKVITALVAIVLVVRSVSKDSDTNTQVATEEPKQIEQQEPIVQDESVSEDDLATEVTPAVDPVVEEEPEVPKEKQEKVPTEYKSALRKAKSYSDGMHMSKAGIYNQLTSEYGEKFSAEAGQYAVDNLDADWKENALKKAKTYQSSMSMSPTAVYDQLVSEHGEKFTSEEAQYAVDNLE